MGHRWTKKDKDAVRLYRNLGASHRTIAKKMNRSIIAICQFFQKDKKKEIGKPRKLSRRQKGQVGDATSSAAKDFIRLVLLPEGMENDENADSDPNKPNEKRSKYPLQGIKAEVEDDYLAPPSNVIWKRSLLNHVNTSNFSLTSPRSSIDSGIHRTLPTSPPSNNATAANSEASSWLESSDKDTDNGSTESEDMCGKLLRTHRFRPFIVAAKASDIKHQLGYFRAHKARSRAIQSVRHVRGSSHQSSSSIGSKMPNGSASVVDMSPDVYEVEKVLGVLKSSNGRKMYLLKWKGYDYKVSSWETSATGCEELLLEYNNRERALYSVMNRIPGRSEQLYNNRYFLHSFYLCHKWEDQFSTISARAGHGPIYVENWVESNFCRRKFSFITTNKISDEAMAQFKKPDHLAFCKCDTYNCGSSKNCCPDIYGMKYPYTSLGRVRQNFDVINDWLIECSDGCSCGPDCPTRVVQRGRQIPIVIFRTVDCGWSVRTLANIKANSFVMEYIGEVITIETAKKSRLATYQFDMDACHEAAFVVDALHYGNEARFVNHSCEPNMVVRGVFSDRFDMRYHRIAYFAARDIAKGEELTINYFSKHSDDEFKKLTRKRSNKSCFCKARNCRGFLI